MLEGEVIKVVGKAAVRGVGHWIMRTLSVLAVIGVGWAIYAGVVRPITKPNPTSTTNQQANKIVNQYFTVESERCWVNLFGIKTLCFKDKTAYKIIKEEGEIKLKKND